MTSELVVTSRSRAWWHLLWLLIGLVGLGLIVGVWWYYSTGDLAALRKAAKQHGLPTTVEEWNRPVSPASEQAQIERLGVLSKLLKEYDSEQTLKKIPGDPKRDRLRPFLPIPSAARDFHAALDQAVVVEALALLDQLPAERIVRYNGDHRQRPKDTIGPYRQTIRWLSERILLADEEQAVVEVRRLLRLLLTFDVASDIDSWVMSSLISIFAPSMAARLPALQPHRAEIDATLARIETRMPEDVRQGLVGGFIEELRLITDPEYARWMTVDILGIGDPPPWYDPYVNPVRIRAGRAVALERFIKRDQQLQRHGLSHGYVAALSQDQQVNEALREWHLSEWLPKRVGTLHAMMDHVAIVAHLHIRLLRSQLNGEPWPVDPFDSAGLPVREFKRDGQVIGAYSFGDNQIDDGGDRRKDRLFLLFGPWDAPTTEPAAE